MEGAPQRGRVIPRRRLGLECVLRGVQRELTVSKRAVGFRSVIRGFIAGIAVEVDLGSPGRLFDVGGCRCWRLRCKRACAQWRRSGTRARVRKRDCRVISVGWRVSGEVCCSVVDDGDSFMSGL